MVDVNLKVYQQIDPQLSITEAQITKQKEEERKAQAKVEEAEDREMSSGVCVCVCVCVCGLFSFMAKAWLTSHCCM